MTDPRDLLASDLGDQPDPERCAACGSEDIYLESPAEGWSCRNCGRSDSDE
jgi:ribosomal protein L37AE/L43A